MGTTVPVTCDEDGRGGIRKYARSCLPTVRAGGAGCKRPVRRRGPRHRSWSLCRSWLDSRTGVRHCRRAATTPPPTRCGRVHDRPARPRMSAGSYRSGDTVRVSTRGHRVGPGVAEENRCDVAAGKAIQIPRHGRVAAIGTEWRARAQHGSCARHPTDRTGDRHPDGPDRRLAPLEPEGSRRRAVCDRARTVLHPPPDCVLERTAAARRAAAVGPAAGAARRPAARA